MPGGFTEFGKELRKMRIDRGEILKAMSDKLGYTPSYLSAIECGKRAVPGDLIARLQELYALTDEEAARLEAARDATLKDARIGLEGASKEQRNVALLFARTFKDLSAEDLERMQGFLASKRKEKG